jgi:casein kinase 1 epsilon
MDLLVGGKYKLTTKIGSGSFGEIYQAIDPTTGEQFAVKLESAKTKFPQLLYEVKLYKVLTGGTGIPKVHWYGAADKYNCMVIDLLGQDLEDLFQFCKNEFKLRTVLMIAEQALHRIEYLHSRSFLHRDIKPENFLIGMGKKTHVIHLIDYGLGKMYRNIKTGEHIPMIEGRSLVGTARYASINTHMGLEQSRRDDLLAIGYVLIYFLKGSLPWVGIKTKTKKEKYELIKQKKLETTVTELCGEDNDAFIKYFEYCSNLEFEQKPDYSFLRKLFRKSMKTKGFSNDYIFDWVSILLTRMIKTGNLNVCM